MGLNRNLLMGQNVDLKNIKAMMTVGYGSSRYGFRKGNFGSLDILQLAPESIKSCTINNITVNNIFGSSKLFSYLKQNNGKTIPVIFHFD